MNTIRIDIDDVTAAEYSIPENWEECSTSQLIKIWDTYNQPNGVALFQVMHLLCHLMAMPCKDEPKLSYGEIVLKYKMIVAHFNLMDELDETHLQKNFVLAELLPSLDFAKEPLLLFHSRAPWLFGWRGPKTGLNGMTLEQFALASKCLSQFVDEPNDKHLNDLIGVLYRPFFMPFINRFNLIELYSWLAGKCLPLRTRHRLMMCWKGHLEHIMSWFPEVFTEEKESEPNRFGWEATFVGLAGEKFGDYEKVKTTSVIPVLINLEALAERQREIEEKTNQNNTDHE